jgi:hypothetical protein
MVTDFSTHHHRNNCSSCLVVPLADHTLMIDQWNLPNTCFICLQTVAGLLHSGALDLRDMSVFARSIPISGDIGILCAAEKLRGPLVKAGVVGVAFMVDAVGGPCHVVLCQARVGRAGVCCHLAAGWFSF